MSDYNTNARELPFLVRHLRALAYTLNLVRFSLIILIAAAALLASGQGQDLLIGVGEDNHYGRLLLGVTVWAGSIWLWARVLLNIQFPAPPVDADTMAGYRRWTPRVLGLLGFWLVALDSYNAGGAAYEQLFWPCIILGVVFFALVTWRRAVARKLAQLQAGPLAHEHWLYVDEQGGQPMMTNFWTAMNNGIGRFGLLMLIIGTGLFIWGVNDPISMGNRFDVILLLFVWGATFLPLGSLITYLANLKGVPILILLLIAALVFSLWNDNHLIRALAGTSPDARPHIDQALADWRSSNCADGDCGRFVVVATAGGGIRAGFWTGTVLGSLHQEIPAFDQQLFAISGVSGGSVGATFYRAAAIGGTGSCTAGFRNCLLDALGKDYLAPLSAALLYPDLTQRFLPKDWLPDRALALEQAWAEGFAHVYGRDALNGSFAGLAEAQGRAWPALFLNATWANSGGRLVASSLRLDQNASDQDTPDKPPFSPLPKDQLDVLGHDLRLTSAAHNSARFPYVSPPGSWRNNNGKVAGRLQDGGLFENYGAETAVEILRHAKTRLKGDFHPLVILISSDPKLADNLADIQPGKVKNFAAELFTTLRTLFKTRVAHGNEGAAWLKQWAEDNQADFAYFHMCPPGQEQGADPPLGWALSGQAQRTIQGYLLDRDREDKPFPPASCREANQDELAKLRRLLSPPGA
jgi:hypothetical protein